MFDWYEPQPALSCPECGAPLVQWQGKEGPRGSFVWRQGVTAPVDQRADEGVRLPEDRRRTFRLPGTFCFYSYDCAEHRPIDARGTCVEGTWHRTELLPLRGRR